MAKLTDKEIVAVSNPRTCKAIREWAESLTVDLRRENQTGNLSDFLQEQLTVVLKYFNSFCVVEEAELQVAPNLALQQTKTAPAQPDEPHLRNMNRAKRQASRKPS